MIHYALIIITTMIWGLSFIAQKWMLQDFSPLWSTALRFSLAGLLSLPILLKKKSFSQGWSHLKGAFWISLFLFGGMLLQMVGLQYTTIAKSSFITTLYAFFVPMILLLKTRVNFSKWYWFLLVSSLIGIFLMCEADWGNFNRGDFYTMLCALCFAFQILGIEKFLKNYSSSLEMNGLQCFFVGILAIFFSLVIEGLPANWSPLLKSSRLLEASSLTGLLIVGIFSSFLGFMFQIEAQKKISAQFVSLVLLLESPFGAFFGYFLLREMLSLKALLGGFIVLIAVAMVPLIPKKTNLKVLA